MPALARTIAPTKSQIDSVIQFRGLAINFKLITLSILHSQRRNGGVSAKRRACLYALRGICRSALTENKMANETKHHPDNQKHKDNRDDIRQIPRDDGFVHFQNLMSNMVKPLNKRSIKPS